MLRKFQTSAPRVSLHRRSEEPAASLGRRRAFGPTKGPVAGRPVNRARGTQSPQFTSHGAGFAQKRPLSVFSCFCFQPQLASHVHLQWLQVHGTGTRPSPASQSGAPMLQVPACACWAAPTVSVMALTPFPAPRSVKTRGGSQAPIGRHTAASGGRGEVETKARRAHCSHQNWARQPGRTPPSPPASPHAAEWSGPWAGAHRSAARPGCPRFRAGSARNEGRETARQDAGRETSPGLSSLYLFVSFKLTESLCIPIITSSETITGDIRRGQRTAHQPSP